MLNFVPVLYFISPTGFNFTNVVKYIQGLDYYTFIQEGRHNHLGLNTIAQGATSLENLYSGLATR